MYDRGSGLREAAGRHFDVIVVGGGINGAGIARDASARGLSVLLLEQHDWGFGTTWRSTKLIHGGLRYLEHGDLPLVFEALRERGVLLRTASHLVRPLPFLLPVYRDDRHSPAVLHAGLIAYDLLALGGGLPRHRSMAPTAALAAEPRLRSRGLRRAFGYWDAQVALPERLCLENVLRAREAGATVLSYVRVESVAVAHGAVAGVQARDLLTGRGYEYRASLVVNAAGPWVDELLRGARLPARRLGSTRGTHLVVRFSDGGPRCALYAEAAGDHRPFFVIPWRGVHLIGTTDVRVSGPSETRPDETEVLYLREAAEALLPSAHLTDADVWYAFAGVRPLPYSPAQREGAVSRRYHLLDHAPEGVRGLYSVVGGKLSTYRNLAQRVTTRLLGTLGKDDPGCTTGRAPLVPGDWSPSCDDPTQLRLWQIYGAHAGEILAAMRTDPSQADRLCPHTFDTVAQARHAVRYEGAVTVADVLLRRTPAGWSRCLGMDAAPTVARVLAQELAWAPDEERRACDAYRCEALATFRPGDGALRCFE
jgi:glycerol-3-phosphate dehydrogenase